MHNQTNLFPEIGVIAEQTDKAEQRETDGTSGETDEAHVDSEENIMQEIESLCMNCEKQVRELSFFIKADRNNKSLHEVGSYPSHVDLYSFLPRGHNYVFPMRSLWYLQ